MSDVDDDTLDHQGMVIELIDAFAEHDATGLAQLDAAGRAAQWLSRPRPTPAMTTDGVSAPPVAGSAVDRQRGLLTGDGDQ